MGVWEYGGMGVKNSIPYPELPTHILLFLILLINFSVQVLPYSHTPILPYFI